MQWVLIGVLSFMCVGSMVLNGFQVYWFLRRHKELEDNAFIDQAERRVYLNAAQAKLKNMETERQRHVKQEEHLDTEGFNPNRPEYADFSRPTRMTDVRN